MKMSTHFPTCEICAPLQGRVYSISGKDKRFPSIQIVWRNGYRNVHPNCRHVFTPYIESLRTDDEIEAEIIKANQPFVDPRPEVERTLYNKQQAANRRMRQDRYQFERYKARLGEDAPKTFSAFRRMKKADGASWKKLQGRYRQAGQKKIFAAQGETGLQGKDVAKSAKVDIMTIQSPPIERGSNKGRPSAISVLGADINNRHKQLIGALPEFDSRVVIPKSDISLKDMSALTAYTGDEFAVFTKGSERLVIRGNKFSVNIDTKQATKLAQEGWKWSGHTHPGLDSISLEASDGDYRIAECFPQRTFAIYNSKGDFRLFFKG